MYDENLEIDFGMGQRPAPQGQPLRPGASTTVAPEITPAAATANVTEIPYTAADPASDQLFDLLRRYFRINAETYENDHQCRHAIATAASECLMYGFFPGRHVRVRCIAGEWVCEEGYRAWLDCANEAAKVGRFCFDVETIPMTSAEVQRFIPVNEYTPGDLGYFARVLRSDQLRMYKEMERQYDPEWQVGFWKTKGYREVDGYGNLGGWHPDPIWAGRRPEDTAKTRASKAALMVGFSLIELDKYDVETRLRRLLVSLEAEVEDRNRSRDREARDRMLLTRPAVERTTDGDLLWA